MQEGETLPECDASCADKMRKFENMALPKSKDMGKKHFFTSACTLGLFSKKISYFGPCGAYFGERAYKKETKEGFLSLWYA